MNTVLIAIVFKVSSVCIILLTFINLIGNYDCFIYTTKSKNTFQQVGFFKKNPIERSAAVNKKKIK